MEAVPVPQSLSDRQIKVAKAWVQNEMNEGLNQSDFCRKLNLSTATLHKWLKDIAFSKYVQDLKGQVISEDEILAYHAVKRHILQRVQKQNPTDKDIQLFTENFEYVIRHEQQKAMEKLGITPEGKQDDSRSIEDKKAALLQRLQNKNTGGNTNV
jgi:hypothetical protein